MWEPGRKRNPRCLSFSILIKLTQYQMQALSIPNPKHPDSDVIAVTLAQTKESKMARTRLPSHLILTMKDYLKSTGGQLPVHLWQQQSPTKAKKREKLMHGESVGERTACGHDASTVYNSIIGSQRDSTGHKTILLPLTFAALVVSSLITFFRSQGCNTDRGDPGKHVCFIEHHRWIMISTSLAVVACWSGLLWVLT